MLDSRLPFPQDDADRKARPVREHRRAVADTDLAVPCGGDPTARVLSSAASFGVTTERERSMTVTTETKETCPTWCSQRDVGHRETEDLHVSEEHRLVTLTLEEPWIGESPLHGERVWQPRTAEVTICQRLGMSVPVVELSIHNTKGKTSSHHTLTIDEAHELGGLLQDAFVEACEGSLAALDAREEIASA